MSLWIKCKDASELASRAMDQGLPLASRVALNLHHLVCVNCARYARQLMEIRRLLKWESTVESYDAAMLSQEAVHRIKTELQKRLER